MEYLIKYARLSNTDDPIYTRQWLAAVDSSIRVLYHASNDNSATKPFANEVCYRRLNLKEAPLVI